MHARRTPPSAAATRARLLRADRLGRRGSRLVRDQLRLDDDPQRPVERLHLVLDRGDGALGERDEPGRADADGGVGGRPPVDLPNEHARAEVELALVREELPVAHVEGLVVDEEADDLAVVTLTSVWPDSG